METRPSFLNNRWVQFTLGIIGMVSVTNLQYSWTFFVPEIELKFSWSRKDIQVAFTLFVLAETWLVPIEAYLADRFGSKPLVFLGGILVALSWVGNSAARSLGTLYLSNALGGAGAGIVYGISIGNALRWFPDRRGLAAGLTAAAFGAGSALTVAPIRAVIAHFGYEAAFFWFGLGQGAIVLATALVMRKPQGIPSPALSGVIECGREYAPLQMLRTPVFWLLYIMMTLVTVGGLMAIAQLAPMAESYVVVDAPFVAGTVGLAGSLAGPGALSSLARSGTPVGAVLFSVLGGTVTALTLAASVDRILNGLTRPFFGWISDRIGREKTMFAAFLFEALSILGLLVYAQVPILFVIFSGLTLFGWGEVYSLFPALCGDMFGRKFAATNYALLYTAKGTASLLVPLGSFLFDLTHSWLPIFALAIAFDVLVAFLALFVLRPMRKRWKAIFNG